MQTYPIILGTAGHIDHGKTSLVKALTGIDTDRLKVEKERGITTELGFAHLDLGGKRFGLVDVPGHERFIRAMLAGAGGLDLVCLVIAADEGIMPQTREHLDICELLGVRQGVVALTKSDLVDEEWLELVQEEIREGLSDSFLADAPMVPVSSKSGAGLDELKKVLIDLTSSLSSRSPDGRFRLPVDRIFTIKGFGTVVTGTLVSGTVEVGEDIEVSPSGKSGKVRGIQVHGEEAVRARAGMRCAINVSGLAVEDITRGDVLIHPGELEASHLIDARFRYLKTSRAPLPRQSKVLIHHGSAQRLATMVLADRDELLPGDETLLQIRLDATEPLVALPGDRFIARGFVVQEHYGTTLGGGEILRVQTAKLKKSATDAREHLSNVAGARSDERKVELEIKAAQAAARDAEDLAKRTGLSKQALGKALKSLVDQGNVLVAGKGKLALYLHAETMARLEKQCVDILEAFHEESESKAGMSRAELQSRLPNALPSALFDLLISELARRKAVEEDQDLLRRPGRGAKAKAGLSELEERIAAQFAEWKLTPDKPKTVATTLGADASETKSAMEKLIVQGRLVRVTNELYVDKSALEDLQGRLETFLADKGQITPGEWKELVGATRKFTIPLAEHFDKEKVTLRIGDIRKLRKR